MEKNILNAFERTTKSKRFKENGFIAGVIYGDNVKEATSVKFEESSLRKILAKHGSNAKVWVKYGEGKKFGFIKEIQRHPVTAKITHIDVQLVSKDHEIKLQLPIEFKGEKNLVANLLKLNIQKTEIDVFGKMALMPDVVVIDVSEKELGDTITIKNFNLDKEIKISDNEDEIYATITRLVEENNAESEEEVTE
ncbi:50S ribosomal protein L25 [Clostridium gasigenes]|uniref:50S ribosomal protein L25 n=1 Tax=Clostridium gasigenes TaxID=94869 RepID=UPI0014382EE9|nr:50S ribosomal protein L25 [Clostridium gasigenes]NKF06661.1 50S ribosomal protein L25 [Clostridium gasigenes]QSW20989.1 50S ribosomal protein L25 [Clostridium gasigenes]